MTTRVLTEIALSRHARERYRERVWPHMDDEQFEIALAEVLRHGTLTTHPPQWYAARSAETSSLHLVVGDVVFPLCEDTHGDRWIAKTCLARGSMSDAVRERRNRNRTAEAHRRKARRRA